MKQIDQYLASFEAKQREVDIIDKDPINIQIQTMQPEFQTDDK